MTLGNSIKEASNSLYQEYEGVYTFSGIINDMDYFIHSTGEYAIWYTVYDSNFYMWNIGSEYYLGSDYSAIYAGSRKLPNKCPNNEGYSWSWKLYDHNTNSWVGTNEVYLKCENEDDFCTYENPCGIDEGDCDTHDECQFGLNCGSNNCPDSFDPDMDCCYINCLDNWIGDMFCDDANNYKECNWDGGDCCGEYVINGFFEFCDCHDPDYVDAINSKHLPTN